MQLLAGRTSRTGPPALAICFGIASTVTSLLLGQLARGHDGALFGWRLYRPMFGSMLIGLSVALIPSLRRLGLAWLLGGAFAAATALAFSLIALDQIGG